MHRRCPDKYRISSPTAESGTMQQTNNPSDKNPNLIFDNALLQQRLKRAAQRNIAGVDFLFERCVQDLEDRLSTIERRFARAVIVNPYTSSPAACLQRSGKAETIETVDYQANDSTEFLPLEPASADLIVSLQSLQFTNDTPGMMMQIKQALKPDGLFLGCMAGAGTLGELRESLLQAESELTGGVSPRVAPFADVRDAGALLQRAGFALPVTDIENITVRYDNMFALLADIRAMGMANILSNRSRKILGRRFFMRAAEIYAERFSDPDGRIRASFPTIWMSGWAPHASQQQPLKPGSAKHSLAEALRANETKTQD